MSRRNKGKPKHTSSFSLKLSMMNGANHRRKTGLLGGINASTS